MTFTTIDICFLLVIFIFAISALVKGFVNELFSKVSVIGGLGAAIFLAPKLDFYVHQTVKNNILSISLSFLLIFVVVFLVLNILRHIVAKIFEGEIMKGLDKTLGFILGIAEGLVVVALIITVVKIQPWFDYENLFEGSVLYKILGNLINLDTSYLSRYSS